MSGAPYIVWSPDGETPPKKSFATHKEAHQVAWRMATAYPGRQFYVMARAGKGALSPTPSPDAPASNPTATTGTNVAETEGE